MRRLHEQLGGDIALPALAGLPDWLRLQIIEAHTAYVLNLAERTCVHQPSASNGIPAFAALWRPGVLACPACLHLLEAPRGREHICDSCGRDDPDLALSFAELGPLFVAFGVCTGCKPSLDPAAAAATTTITTERHRS